MPGGLMPLVPVPKPAAVAEMVPNVHPPGAGVLPEVHSSRLGSGPVVTKAAAKSRDKGPARARFVHKELATPKPLNAPRAWIGRPNSTEENFT